MEAPSLDGRAGRGGGGAGRGERGDDDGAPVLRAGPGAATGRRAGSASGAGRPALRDLLELTKPRITGLVTFVAGAAALAAGTPPGLGTVAALLAGTWLLAGGTNALNQVLERDRDARMERTRGRPLPDARVGPGPATAGGLLLVVAGTGVLLAGVNLLTAGIGFASAVLYAGVYTPMKTRSPLSLPVGAVPGALPALGGWTAATGSVGSGGLALFGVLFFWQLPHFLALGHLHRRDYRRAGFAVLAADDPADGRAGTVAVLGVLGLIPVSLLPTLLGHAGWAYAAVATAAGLAYLLLAGRFALAGAWPAAGGDPGEQAGGGDAVPGDTPGPDAEASAGRLFAGSLGYLPLVLGVLVADARWLSTAGPAPEALPTLNAALNGTAALVLAAAFVLVRRGRYRAHAVTMMAAAATSAVFLASYLVHHARVGSVAYGGEGGALRLVYYAVLATHAVLAAAVVPLALTSLVRGLRGRWDGHRRIARWTLPVWLYVSVTGFVVYVLLYVA